MDKDLRKTNVEIWGGIECTYNRVNDNYMDQLERAGFYIRNDDLDRIAELGIKVLRFPIIWEKHVPEKESKIDWSFTEQRLNKLQDLYIEPIAGLVHHGSGPKHVNFFDGSFETGLAEFALEVATQFPWIKYYTPVNEPLTTARFCGLYGHWFPHGKSDETFYQILISECKATVLAMEAIRTINPNAKLLQTEDLGKTHSTELLKPQAAFENRRRWLSFDIISGRVTPKHALYDYLLECGVTKEQLFFFEQNNCPPDILGINHYVTSERFIDENFHLYPEHTWGGNDFQKYADVEAVRVSKPVVAGPYTLLKETWERFHLPMAVTEVHLHCTREEQLRWFKQVYDDANKLKAEGVDIRAITAWAILGSYDWCTLLTKKVDCYEPGLFDVRAPQPRATALTKLVKTLNEGKSFEHAVMHEEGWWKRSCRVIYEVDGFPKLTNCYNTSVQPILITGKTGTLGKAFSNLCALRGIHFIVVGRDDVNITDEESIDNLIKKYNPWAVVNTAGFVNVDEAEVEKENCFLINSVAPKKLSSVCNKLGIKFVTFSSDLVFDGEKKNPYLESDVVSPINIYGQSKAEAEQSVLINNPSALIIRTSAFFGPWDRYNFVYHALNSFKNNIDFVAANDLTISPTYVPDLVNTTLDLLLDDENGIWNLSNKGEITWAMLAEEVAARSRYNPRSFKAVPVSEMGLIASRPNYSVLKSEKGFELPSLDDALGRYFWQQDQILL